MQKCKTRSAIWIFIVLLSLTTGAAQAQTNVSVNLVKGNAQIGYPLGRVSDNELSVPIGLSYNATGVQISEKGYGEFGLGVNWNLSAGGSISREVRSLPDDFMGVLDDPRKGWLIGTTAQDVATRWGELASVLDPQFTYTDSECDLYSISISGLSLQFVFDNNKQIRTIPYNDVKIVPYFVDPVNKADIYKFEVTTNNGITYEFAEYETTNKYCSDFSEFPQEGYHGFFKREYNLYGKYKPTFFKSKWKLSKVSAKDGRFISLRYEDATPFTYSEPKIMSQSWVPGEMLISYNLFTVYNTTFRKRLVEVTSDLSRAYFNFNQGNFQAYDRIDFFDRSTDTEKKVKSFSLNYKNVFYKKPDHTTVEEGSMRRFLESITESNDCSSFPPQKFLYYGVNFETGETLLPEQGSYKQDWSGFFNDSPDIPQSALLSYQTRGMDELTPQMYRHYASRGDNVYEFFLPDSIPGWDQSGGGGSPAEYDNISVLPGRKRSVNPNTIHYGSLSSIINAFGGVTTVEYEPNDYRYSFPTGVFPDVEFQGKGIRVKKITVYDGISHEKDQVTEYDYKDADGKSSGRITYLPQFSLASTTIRSTFDMSPSSDLYYKRVTVKETGKGKSVFEYLVPAVYPTLTEGDWKETTNYHYPFSPNMEYDFERGLLHRKYEYKEGDNTNPIHETQYEYQRISQNPVEVKSINFDYTSYYDREDPAPLENTGPYKQLTNVDKVLLKQTNYVTDPGDNTRKLESKSTYFYESLSHKFLTRTTTENSDGTIYETRYKYAQDFPGITTTSDEATTALKTMNEQFMHGAPVETITSMIKGGTSKVLSASFTKYKISTGGLALPSQQLKFPAVSGFTESSIQAVSGGQSLVIDSRYIATADFEVYKGLKPLTINDGKGRRQAWHWGYKSTLPVAEIANAAADEVVFSNFETTTGNDFTLSSPVYVSGSITGKALSLPVNGVIQAGFNKGLGKFYRFTCMIKAATNGNITVQLSNGSANLSPVSISFSSAAKWQFIEKLIDVSLLTTQCTVKVSSNVALALDNVSFYPASGSIKSYTYDPVQGKTSETDFKGNALFYEYDNMGKLTYVRDGDGNILKKNEFKFNNYISSRPKSGFSASYSVLPSLHKNDVATYTAEENCLSPVTHSWYVNGSLVSSGATLSHTFNAEGKVNIKHTVTHASMGSSTSERNEFVFSAQQQYPEITISGPKIINSCDVSYSRTFKIKNPTPGVMYKWEVISPTGGDWEAAGNGIEVTLCRPEDYTVRYLHGQTADWMHPGEEIYIHFLKGSCPISAYTSCPYPYRPVVQGGDYVNTNPPYNTGTKTSYFTTEKMKKFGPYDQTVWTYKWEVLENNQWVVKDNFTDLNYNQHKRLQVQRNPPYVNYKVRCSVSPNNPATWYVSNEVNVSFGNYPPPNSIDVKPRAYFRFASGDAPQVVDTCARGTYTHVFMVDGMQSPNIFDPMGSFFYAWQVYKDGSWKMLEWFFEMGELDKNGNPKSILPIITSGKYANYKVRCIGTNDFNTFYISDELGVYFVRGNCH